MNYQDLIEKLTDIPYMRVRKQSKYHKTKDFFWNETGKLELYVFNPESKNTTQVSSNDMFGAWCLRSPVNDELVYIQKDLEGNESFTVYQLNLKSKELIQLGSSLQHNNSVTAISPDGKFVIINSRRNERNNLFKITIKTGEEQQLTNHQNPLFGYTFWGENDWIFYYANETTNRNNYDIWGIRADGSENRLVYQYSNASKEMIYDLSKDGNLLLIGTQTEKTKQIGLFDFIKNKIRWFGGDYDETPMEISGDGTKILAIRFKGIERIPVVYDIKTGKERELKIRGVVIEGAFCLNDEYVFYARSDSKTPMSLALYNLVSDTEEIILRPKLNVTSSNFVEGKYIKYPSFDEKQIPAILYKPKITKGEKAPALLFHPGGPGGQVSLLFLPILQILSQLGIVILAPSCRGSIGFGKEYYEKNLNDLGGGDALDYVYGKKYLETLPYIDQQRIGVFGGSYGGYMTYILLTKYADSNWSAGAALYGITHWKTAYDAFSPAIKFFFESLLGKYDENKALWEDRSPLTHIEKLQAPLLMIQGVNDPRCPIGESRQFRDKLVELGLKAGIDFEYHEFSAVGHGTRETKRAVKENKLIIEFFLKKFGMKKYLN